MRRTRMIVFAMAVFALFGAASAGAQFRIDANVSVPFYGGINLDDLSSPESAFQSGTWIKNVIPIPDVELYYQFGSGSVRAGVGARIYTIIIESVLYPGAYLEFDLNPMVVNLNVGGLFFVPFGLIPFPAGQANIVLPDLNIAYKFTDWFRLGVGAFGIAPLENLSTFAFIGYVNARFVMVFK